jgi:hypothetical protein
VEEGILVDSQIHPVEMVEQTLAVEVAEEVTTTQTTKVVMVDRE